MQGEDVDRAVSDRPGDPAFVPQAAEQLVQRALGELPADALCEPLQREFRRRLAQLELPVLRTVVQLRKDVPFDGREFPAPPCDACSLRYRNEPVTELCGLFRLLLSGLSLGLGHEGNILLYLSLISTPGAFAFGDRGAQEVRAELDTDPLVDGRALDE